MVYSRSMTIPTERGCGTRSQGGIYAECGMGRNGMPIEWFIKDRPIALDRDLLRLSDIGVRLMKDRSGVWHILDIVGVEHYPNVTDFIEEVRRYGLSRKLSPNLEYNRLTKDSTILLAHRKAIMGDWAERMNLRTFPRPRWNQARPDRYFWKWCPKVAEPGTNPDYLDAPFVERHDQYGQNEAGIGGMCAGLWWEDIEYRERREDTRPQYQEHYRDARDMAVAMPSFSYFGRRTPPGMTPSYKLGIFLAMPITNLVVVGGEGSKESERILQEQGLTVLDNGNQAGAEEADSLGILPVFRVGQ